MLTKYLSRFFARHRHNRIVSRIARGLVELQQGYENLNYNYFENGENFVLDIIRQHLAVETVFDVGANQGEWSKIAAKKFPEARIYSFEVLPETHRQLVANCKAHPRIVPVAFGLGDREEEREVYYAPGRSGKTTCVANFFETFHGGQAQVGRGKVLTGDRFCRDQGVGAIDFLKLDVEGYEPQVLKGFQEMLAAGKIRMIQFEYGYINVATHFLLKDFYELFHLFRMRAGKIYPNHVDFREYRFQDENFLGPNYLAVHVSLEPLFEALKRGHLRRMIS